MPHPVLQTIAERESSILAPYAMHSIDSAGRLYEEPQQSYRGPFQRDRDRLVHSAAYRRLSGKMQVFTDDMGDYHRTRLTHTQEVASIARTLARALKLNEDLVEALALFHDIGHPPFGHAGEDALADCLADEGGFSHNQYALIIAEQLEVRHHGFPGLNLTREVLQGQETRIDKNAADAPLLEVQVVEAADSMTYNAHDTDDALKLGLVHIDELQELDMIRICTAQIRQRGDALSEKEYQRAIIHALLDCQVSNVLDYTSAAFEKFQWESAAAARQSDFRIGTVGEIARAKSELERFLYERVYRHAELVKSREVSQQQIRQLFDNLVATPDKMPQRFVDRAAQIGLKRSVGDYIAGMTDRFFEQQFLRFVGSQSPD